jgi:hypothetical protein
VPVLLGVSVWRLLIVASAVTGFALAAGEAGGFGDALPGLSQQASLLTAIVYFGLLCYPACTGFRRHEPHSPWLRGAMAVLLLLVGGTFLTLMGGSLDEGWSLFEHLVTPLLVLADWIVVGRNQVNCRWWHPLTWLVFPLAYLVYYNVAAIDIYDFPLGFGDSEFAGYLFGFVAAVIAAGYLLYGIGRIRAAAVPSGPDRPFAPVGYPPQQPYPQQPYPPEWYSPPGYQPQPGHRAEWPP